MKALREFRIQLGCSKKQFADMLGVSKSLYEKVEWGCRAPSQSFLHRFKRAFPTFDMNLFFNKSD